jgi:hypothetical protein
MLRTYQIMGGLTPKGGANMEESQILESALIDICEEFLEYLSELKHKGVISEAEYESHSMMKVKFLNEVKKGSV